MTPLEGCARFALTMVTAEFTAIGCIILAENFVSGILFSGIRGSV